MQWLNHRVGYSFVGPLQPTVNGLIGKAVNESSAKYVYIMSAYSKGPIRHIPISLPISIYFNITTTKIHIVKVARKK